jgi:hypothetical protein
LPPKLFLHPEDARLQLERAFAYHTSAFGHAPSGLWPSEGSLSEEVIGLLADSDYGWTATDEDILARSLHRVITPLDLYRPYAVGTGTRTVRALFRDHRLSDLIGFAYQSWDAEAAAGDFVLKVRDAGRRFRDEGGRDTPVVTVILDGENAWEHYAGGGRPFLRALYRRLQEADDIEPVTMREAVLGPARPLSSIFPGSWINGDFYIWAGHRDDHRAWAQLASARRAYEAAAASTAVPEEHLGRAREELLIAEGSDWFWWYGDDHSSDHDREFDELFRRHLRNAYRTLGQPAPDDLHLSNITTAAPPSGRVALPSLSTPAVGDGNDYVGWAGAVDIPLGAGGGTMHRVTGPLVRKLSITADRETLYFKLEGAELARRLRAGDAGLALLIDRPHRGRVLLTDWPPATDGIVTVSLRFAALGVKAGDTLSASVLVTDPEGHVLEQHPAQQPLELEVPAASHDAVHWIV